jgi:hypothetical protein
MAPEEAEAVLETI